MTDNEFIRVPCSQSELAQLRMMIRVLHAQRLVEIVSQLRGVEKAGDLLIVSEILKYADVYRAYDHLLLTAIECTITLESETTELLTTPQTLEFFRCMLASTFDCGGINAPTMTQIIANCQEAQPALRRKFDEAASTSVAATMPSAQGRN